MTRGSRWAVIPGLAAIAAAATLLSAYSGALSARQDATEQVAPSELRDPEAIKAAMDTTPASGPWAYSGASSSAGSSPEQPIAFPHRVHVQGAGMNCLYCHNTATKSPDPGLPSVETCMGCHQIVATQSPEIQKLAQYYSDSLPIPWERIHRVPDYVQFPHQRHVNADVSCQTCHGQVQEMPRVFQYASLNMGWCVNCHVERQVRYDCATCHY